MNILSRGYSALRGERSEQTAEDTLEKLCEKLETTEDTEERYASLLAIKGLSRTHRELVLSSALPTLLDVLSEFAMEDLDVAKTVVETFAVLMEETEEDFQGEEQNVTLRTAQVLLATPGPLHTLLAMLDSTHFYLRLYNLQLLSSLLAVSREPMQSYVLSSPGGIGRLVNVLDDARDAIRNEALLLLIQFTGSNAEIQKLLTFEGMFDRLFLIIKEEGGIGSSSVVVRDCLHAMKALLQWNVSNQNYFRETSCIPSLVPLLLFPVRPDSEPLEPFQCVPFNRQNWPDFKALNALLVIQIVRLLAGGHGQSKPLNQKALFASGAARALCELGLASINAPLHLKSASLFALSDIVRGSSDIVARMRAWDVLLPYQDQLELVNAILAAVELAALDPGATADALRVRAAAAQLVGVVVAADPKLNFLLNGGQASLSAVPEAGVSTSASASASASASDAASDAPAPVAPAPNGTASVADPLADEKSEAVTLPSGEPPSDVHTASSSEPTAAPTVDHDWSSPETTANAIASIVLASIEEFPGSSGVVLNPYTTFFSCALFMQALLAPGAKLQALRIKFNGRSLIGVLIDHVKACERGIAQATNAGASPAICEDWSRIMVSYLSTLCLWLHGCPEAVREYLASQENVQTLIQPITQASGIDALVQGLCAYLLGICYEYNRLPDTRISRKELFPLLQSRVGHDQMVSRILRLSEDSRFLAVGPVYIELDADTGTPSSPGDNVSGPWFSQDFVEFFKLTRASIHHAIHADPSAKPPAPASEGPHVSELELQLKEALAEITQLRSAIAETSKQELDSKQEPTAHTDVDVSALTDRIRELELALEYKSSSSSEIPPAPETLGAAEASQVQGIAAGQDPSSSGTYDTTPQPQVDIQEQQERLDAYHRQLLDREQQLAAVEAAHFEKESHLSARQEGTDPLVVQLQLDIAERDAVIADLRAQCASALAAARELENTPPADNSQSASELADREAALQEAEAALDARAASIEQWEAHRAAWDQWEAQQRDWERSLADKEAALAQWETSLADRGAFTQQGPPEQKSTEPQATELQTADHHAALAQREYLLNEKEAALAAREAALSSNEIASAQAPSQTTSQDLLKRETRLKERELQLSDREGSIVGREKSLAKREASLRNAPPSPDLAALDSLRAEHEAQARELEDLLILLDDLTAKRQRDKATLQAAGYPVSDGE